MLGCGMILARLDLVEHDSGLGANPRPGLASLLRPDPHRQCRFGSGHGWLLVRYVVAFEQIVRF